MQVPCRSGTIDKGQLPTHVTPSLLEHIGQANQPRHIKLQSVPRPQPSSSAVHLLDRVWIARPSQYVRMA